MHKHCFINFEFIFYVTMKNKPKIRKCNTSIAMFEIILEFEKKYEKRYLHSITLICLLMAINGISLYLRHVPYSKYTYL